MNSLEFRNQSNASIKAIDRTIPNLIDNSFLDVVDLAEVDRLFGFKSLNVPGKSRRASSSLNNFSSEEITRMRFYARKVLESVCFKLLPNDSQKLLLQIKEGEEENKLIDIANRWTKIAQDNRTKMAMCKCDDININTSRIFQ
jgi:hypothetical protein